MKLPALLFILAAGFLSVIPLSPARGGALAITGGDLLDVRTGRVSPNALVVIEADRITYAGPFLSDRVPARAKLTDAGGKTIMPGLIDMHVHLNPEQIAPLLLSAGVTTVRELGSPEKGLARLQNSIREGRLPGPRVFAFAPVSTEGHPPFAQRPSTEAEIAPLLHRLRGRYSGVKIFDLPPSLLPVFVASCERQGLLTSAHLDRLGPRTMIEAGVGTVEHIAFLASEWSGQAGRTTKTASMMKAWVNPGPDSATLAEMIAAMRRRNTAVVPTLAALEAMLEPERLPLIQPALATLPANLRQAVVASATKSAFTSGWSTQDYADARRAFAGIVAVTGRLHREGITVLLGSDNLIPGFGIHREMQILRDAGLSNLAVLQAATCNAARRLGQGTVLGVVEAGYLADLLILAGNPLDDIRQVENVESVIKDGVVYDPRKSDRVRK